MHVELTSRCTLACPGCSRTWFAQKFQKPYPKQDLDLATFRDFMHCDAGRKVSHFLLCGNHGDPIYYPDFFAFIDAFRDRTFAISTNGSYQTPQFWSNLRDRLGPDDTVFFSIDGLEQDNHLYRRNSDWPSIMQGLDIMASGSCRVVWKTLIFGYNEDHIDDIRRFALDRGAEFTVDATSFFGEEHLRPRNESHIRWDMTYEHSEKVTEIRARCHSGKSEYVSADGYYWPCCLITGIKTLVKTPLWASRSQWQIQGHNLDQLRQRVDSWAQQVENMPGQAPAGCRMHCHAAAPQLSWSRRAEQG